jgi:acetylornithine deacetylase/succinyl-diaminopimelate desuccinylase-like protein
VTYDRRLLPGETERDVLGAITDLPELAGIELRAAIAQGEHTTYTDAVMRGPKFLPAFLFPEDHSFVQTAARGLRGAGLVPQMGAYRFCTNAAYSAGVAGVPTIGFGPGREEDAHVVDERIAVADVLTAERGYRGIIEAALVQA